MTPEEMKNELDGLSELTDAVKKEIASRMKTQRAMMRWLMPVVCAILAINTYLAIRNIRTGNNILAGANIVSTLVLLWSQSVLIKSYLRLRKQAKTMSDYERMVRGK